MKTIKNQKLFSELVAAWDSGSDEDDLFRCLFTDGQYPEPKDIEIPVFAGGLDHVEVKPRGIYFYDIGSSRGGRMCDSSFVIRP